jgi:DNA transposition AAA+ family ATPase
VSNTQTALPGIGSKLPAAYTAQDAEKIEAVKRWLDDNGKSRSWLAKKSSMASGTVSQVLAGKYPSSPTKQLNQLLSVIETESERLKDGTPGYVQGSVHKLMQLVFDRTRKHQNFGVITGYVGIGKTRCAKEYRTSHPMTLLVESSPNMTPGVMLTTLLESLNNAVPPGLDRKFRELQRVMRGTNYLVIVDEAERLSSSALEYLRRLRDMAEIGVVLVGTEKLTSLIKPQHGQFDQIRSRVGMWPKTIETITRDDADDMVRAAFADVTEVPDEVLDVLWAYSDGSARVLNENLIGALRDYGTGKPLSGELVHVIAKKVLFMDRPRAEGCK